jgi:catechol 2,3-dioxygenase-like lactoylglutathione lyase family enzyme
MPEPRYLLDHIGVAMSDLDAARRFYDAALGALGFSVVMEYAPAFAYGVAGRPTFWLEPEGRYGSGKPMHIAFHAASRAHVDAFHAAGLEAGGRDNGAPGPRPYHEHYYGAFLLDPDGNNVEAVCHLPEG